MKESRCLDMFGQTDIFCSDKQTDRQTAGQTDFANFNIDI